MTWKTRIRTLAKSPAELGQMRLHSIQIQRAPRAVPTAAARLANAGAGVSRKRELARLEKVETKRLRRHERRMARAAGQDKPLEKSR
jgi:hypothetical protein